MKEKIKFNYDSKFNKHLFYHSEFQRGNTIKRLSQPEVYERYRGRDDVLGIFRTLTVAIVSLLCCSHVIKIITFDVMPHINYL